MTVYRLADAVAAGVEGRQPLALTRHGHVARQLAGGQYKEGLAPDEDVRIVWVVVHLPRQLQLQGAGGRVRGARVADRLRLGGRGGAGPTSAHAAIGLSPSATPP